MSTLYDGEIIMVQPVPELTHVFYPYEISESIFNALSNVLEFQQQNSIHVDLSDDDVKKLEAQEQQIREKLEQLCKDAQLNHDKIKKKYEQECEICDQMHDKIVEAHEESDAILHRKAELEENCEYHKASYDENKKVFDEKRNILNAREREARNAREKCDEQNRLLQKYYWVPFYGLYLSVDKLVNDYEIDVDAANKVYDQARENFERADINYDNAKRELHKQEQMLEDIQKKVQAANDTVRKMTNLLLESKHELMHWEGILNCANSLYSSIDNATICPEEIMMLQESLLKLGERCKK